MKRKPHFVSDGVRHATINGHRFHLRIVDPDHNVNYLWIDGRNPPLVLDKNAAIIIERLIDAMWAFQTGDGDGSSQVIDYVVGSIFENHRLHGWNKFLANIINKYRIRRDLHRIYGTIMDIADGSCPVEMGLKPKGINYGSMISPARMDLAITHKCNLNCSKCYLGDKTACSELKELTLEEWLKVYKILWKIGVPNIVFTGGEPTLRHDLIALISEAEEFVTGLITNGTTLAKNGLAEQLRDASLDYVQITIESFDPEIHDKMTGIPGSHKETVEGITAALSAGLQIVTNTTLTQQNAGTFLKTIEFLDDLGVKHIACNTLICSGRGTACKQENGLTDEELVKLLDSAKELAEDLEITLDWYSPTCYSYLDPVWLGFGIKSCSAAAHNMTINPDGSVLPCQSWPETVGNILVDLWETIWNHETCITLRWHGFKDEECDNCAFEDTCAGGCPLDKSPRRGEDPI